jgi:uncharacterized protein (TIGR02246 family)
MGLLASAAVILLALVAWPSAASACAVVSLDAIRKLFDDWNKALKTKNPETVVLLYATDAVLLPTVENGPKIGRDAIKGYFEHFLPDGPSGAIVGMRNITIGCNMAFDAGHYTFTYSPPPPKTKDPTLARYTYVYKYEGGTWLIAHHHSSVCPVLPGPGEPPVCKR